MRWTPLGLSDADRTLAAFDELRQELDRMFWDFERESGQPTRSLGRRGTGPVIHMEEEADDLVLTSELPGFSRKDIEISLNQGVLTLSGHRESSAPEGYRVLRRERGEQRFSKSFSLPCRVDVERAKAVLKDGVLTLKIAKAEDEKPRQIPVKVG